MADSDLPPPQAVHAPTPIQVPDWEAPSKERKQQRLSRRFSRPSAGSRFGPAFSQRFDSLLPPDRRYLRLRRRTFLLVLLAVLLALLALIIGLAVGLTRKT